MSATEPGRVSVLFVCLGNICRSPTAEGVMRELVNEAGLGERIELDSAGTGAGTWGSRPTRAPPGPHAGGASRWRGRPQGAPRDFEEFDLMLAMDGENLRNLHRLARDERGAAKVRLLREFGTPPRGRARRARPLLRRGGRLRARCSTSCRPRARALLEQLQTADAEGAPAR